MCIRDSGILAWRRMDVASAFLSSVFPVLFVGKARAGVRVLFVHGIQVRTGPLSWYCTYGEHLYPLDDHADF